MGSIWLLDRNHYGIHPGSGVHASTIRDPARGQVLDPRLRKDDTGLHL